MTGGAVDLNFTEIANFSGGNVPLNLGYNGEISDPPISAPNPAFSVSLSLVSGGRASMDASVSVTASAFSSFDVSVRINGDNAEICDALKTARWQQGNREDHQHAFPWSFRKHTDQQREVAWGGSQGKDPQREVAWVSNLRNLPAAVTTMWGGLYALQEDTSLPIRTAMLPQEATRTPLWGGVIPSDQESVVLWGTQTYPEICLREYVPPVPPAILLDLSEEAQHSTSLSFDSSDYPIVCTTREPGGERRYPRDYPEIPPEDPLATPTNEIRQVYFIMHTLSVQALPGLQEVEVSSISMSFDIDSHSWLFSATVLSNVDLVRPSSAGVKEIRVTLDGYVWEFAVDSYTQTKVFSDQTWKITGKSKTAYLAAPYVLPKNYTYVSDILASQIITQELNATGFSVTYSTVDWLVGGNAFTYQQNTPIQAISTVAAAIGGVILPHRSQSSIVVKPRYTHSPWEWAATSPVATLTSDIIESMSGTWSPKGDINGVHVTGATSGVNCFVKITGTDGLKKAPQFVSNLLSHQDAGREKGRNILSDTGNQEVVPIVLPVLPVGQTPAIYNAGDLLEISEAGSQPWKGMVIGVNVTASVSASGLIEASQTVSLERHY